MKERPIIMTGESVRAILAGRKTQTRRLIPNAGGICWRLEPIGGNEWAEYDNEGDSIGLIGWRRCPYGAPGDRLWVREAWARTDYEDDGPFQNTTIYRANGEDGVWDAPGGRWRSPLHMPRWASRLTLEVTGVHVERLQAITEADALAEGVTLPERTVTQYEGIHREAYAALWDRINGTRAPWASNPWTWVIEFTRV